MNYKNAQKIMIEKNRGWRGLALVNIINFDAHENLKMIFSFSPEVWDDMQGGHIVLQDSDHYIVVHFDNTDRLPKGQRSVLIKSFVAEILDVHVYPKNDWIDPSMKDHTTRYIEHFRKNRNNHTTSDWNCIRNTCST